MEAIKKRIMIDSDTILIPELKRFIGKMVEIICIEEDKDSQPPVKKHSKFLKAAGKISLDSQAVNDLREKSKI